MTLVAVVDTLSTYQGKLAQFQAVLDQDDMFELAQELQQFFAQIVWAQVIQVDIPKAQWRSVTTEVHRHMRLLAVEVNFLRSARQSQTHQHRLEQIEQRLDQLQGFTQVLITLCQSCL